LARFTTGGGPIAHYAACRDFPALEGTSRLSPHLRFGTIGVRTAYHAAQRAGPGDGPAAWMAQLAWRDFYHQWVWHHPQVLTRCFDSACDDLAWENRTDLFEAWCRGATGFPIVDAAMRQLNATGWMHNRLRMIAAGFLCKDLLCDWRWGEAYFWDRLVDADKPANVGGWQWCASTGADPQPYFRVFNPATQGKRFDPDGRFVRTWVPEVRRLPDRYLHVPAELPPAIALSLGFRLDREYPAPIVDHAERRARALDIYAVARRGRRHAGE
jgi:deoxyribodipyrimidine photo-lyase